jgi:hypothetical protein
MIRIYVCPDKNFPVAPQGRHILTQEQFTRIFRVPPILECADE